MSLRDQETNESLFSILYMTFSFDHIILSQITKSFLRTLVLHLTQYHSQGVLGAMQLGTENQRRQTNPKKPS